MAIPGSKDKGEKFTGDIIYRNDAKRVVNYWDLLRELDIRHNPSGPTHA